jgi:macrodomain Ter protein organizer (MatP/YcbG family)
MVHARFSAVLAAKLADLARAWGISLSETIRRLVEEAVRDQS